MCRKAEISNIEMGVGGTCEGLNYQHPNSVITKSKASSKLLSGASKSQRWQCGKGYLGSHEGMTNSG